jgi:hypothetical protein
MFADQTPHHFEKIPEICRNVPISQKNSFIPSVYLTEPFNGTFHKPAIFVQKFTKTYQDKVEL